MGSAAGRQDLCIFAWGEGIWQAAVKPVDQSPFPTAVAHHNNREREREGGREKRGERGRETEIKGDRDLGGRQLTPLMVGLLCTLASHLRSKAHTERSSIKHSSQQGTLDVLSVSVHPNGLWQ